MLPNSFFRSTITTPMPHASPVAPWLRALLVLVLTGCMLLGACTPKPPPPVLDDPPRFDAVWARHQAVFAQDCRTPDFSLRASVNHFSPDRDARFIVSMWGRTDFPIRMNIQAGVGAMLAYWREDRHEWLGYLPSAQEAYLSDSVTNGARMTGLFMPMRLDTLARLLLGCWGSIVPAGYESARSVDSTLEYTVLKDSQPLILTLSPDGRPLSVRTPEEHGWTMRIDQWQEEDRPAPQRVTLLQGDHTAVIRVQRIEVDIVPWGDAELRLDVPPGTTVWTVPH